MDFCKKRLDETRHLALKEIDGANQSELSVIVKKAFLVYKTIVSNFFTDKSDDIHTIYNSIRDNLYPYNRVSVPDCNAARYNYTEYLEGFQAYISRLIDLRASDDVEHSKLNVSLSNVENRDQTFVSGLFDSDQNPKENIDINNAMKNVEVLIDVYNDMDGICGVLTQNATAIENSDPEYRNEITRGVAIMAKSILNFHHSIITEILECYDMIFNSIQHRTPVSGDKKVEVYQLF